MRYDWPGNVRELQHVVERAVILSRGGPLRIDLEEPVQVARRELVLDQSEVFTDAQVREFERTNLRRAMEAAQGKVHGPGGAAELLGVKPTTLSSRLKALGVKAT